MLNQDPQGKTIAPSTSSSGSEPGRSVLLPGAPSKTGILALRRLLTVSGSMRSAFRSFLTAYAAVARGQVNPGTGLETRNAVERAYAVRKEQ